MTPTERTSSRQALLDDYAEKARYRGLALEATAIRTESLEMREILAHLASSGRLSFDEVRAEVFAGRADVLDPAWLASLARVAALQRFHAKDEEFAIRAFAHANVRMERPRSRRFRKLEFELLLEAGEFDRAERCLAASDDLNKLYYRYLGADLINPFTGAPNGDYQRWLRMFNAPFRAYGLEEVALDGSDHLPFDRLIAESPAATLVEGPLVSVVMTFYRADPAAFLTSVRSILQQTWKNLELIIVDDASGNAYDATLEHARSLDSRIRIVRLSENGGTYIARNAGLAAARGEFVGGQDSDDWSHPRRLEVQVRALVENPAAPGVRVAAVNASPLLTRVRPGYNPVSPNASSLMFRTELARDIGGYLPARKAADNEFHQRLERVAGAPVVELKEPLSIVRILPDSLSRGDFRAGWSHPARRAFRSAYEHWHEHATHADLKLRDTEPMQAPVPVPLRFQVQHGGVEPLDVVYAGDWRQYGGPQKSMLEEIAAARARGLKVGVMHLEAARFMSERTKPICRPLQRLINDGQVVQILQDDPVRVRLLILRYPPILQFPPHQPFKIQADEVLILANQAPSERDGTDIRYSVRDCSDQAERLFGIRATWVPQGPTVRGAIAHEVTDGELAEFDMPGILQVDAWRTDRSRFRNTVPVVGRHSRDNVMKWPEDPDVLRALYPTDGSLDVRVMGGGRTPQKVLRTAGTPHGWVVFDVDEMPVRTFLNSIDFFVYYQHSQAYDAFGRAVLEAIATGCVTVLPWHLEPTFGDAAVYLEPNEVRGFIESVYADPGRYRELSARAIRVAEERFGYEGYADRLESLVGAVTVRGGNEA